MTNKRLWICVASVVFAAVWLGTFFDPAHRPNFSDFKVYWVAGQKAAAHLTVYDVEGHYQFKYSPFVAWLWSLPTHVRSSYLWSRLHYVATGVGFYALFFALAKVVDARRRWSLWAVSCVVFSVAIRDELKLGQVNLWPFLLVLPAWFRGARQDTAQAGPSRPAGASPWYADMGDWLIGAAWGLAIQWKLYALLLGPLWVMRRRPAVLGGMLAVNVLTLAVALTLIHGASFALSENLRWVQSLSASSQDLIVSEFNVSVLGVLGKWAELLGLPLGPWAYLIWFGLLVLGLLVLIWAEQTAQRREAQLPWFWAASFAWALVAVVNPLVWPYWQLLVAPLFLLYFAQGTERSWRGDGPLFWLVVGLFAAMNWLQNTPVVHYGGGLFAVILLMADAYRRARGPALPATGGASTRLTASSA